MTSGEKKEKNIFVLMSATVGTRSREACKSKY
jgi:hypothetical protein